MISTAPANACFSLIVALVVMAAGAAAPTTAAEAKVSLKKVGTFNQPAAIASPPGDRSTLFVVEQEGRVRAMPMAGGSAKTFLDIRNLVGSGGERGLLGLAFAPDYSTTGLFYVYYTDRSGTIRIVEYRRDARGKRSANANSARELMSIRHPLENHNGGQLAFGPDGYLYIGVGDGGSANDPDDNAQNLDSLLGKILRIDPHASGGRTYSIPPSNPFAGQADRRGEIYSYGLRNPWRFSFDSKTGAIYIGDVGQDEWEEVDYRKKGQARGVNFGWPAYEGNRRNPGRDGARNAVKPIFTYRLHSGGDHGEGGACAVIGGYVVRDPGLRSLRGRYVYGDFCAGFVRSFRVKNGRAKSDRSVGGLTVSQLSSFGLDGRGRLYAASLDGSLFRFVER